MEVRVEKVVRKTTTPFLLKVGSLQSAPAEEGRFIITLGLEFGVSTLELLSWDRVYSLT